MTKGLELKGDPRMMQFRLVASAPAADTQEDLVINERAWRPARSLMAIANQRYIERDGSPIVSFEELEDVDQNTGYGIPEAECRQLANMMEAILQDPFVMCDYGMTTDIEGGETAYTYPSDMCTAYLEDVETGAFYENLDVEGIVGRRVRSWFRISEEEMKGVIDFMKTCGGFVMP
jgi:hypothetical protein